MFREMKTDVKMHPPSDLRGSIPTFVGLTSGVVHDVHFLETAPPEEELVVILDRGYLDFERLYAVHRLHDFFMIRAKQNLRLRRLSFSPVDKESRVRVDLIIYAYPELLRRMAIYNVENRRRLVFVTNLFSVSPKTFANLYKQRWQAEKIYKWIKEHLRIKSFYSTSANAVRPQFWVAIIVYLLFVIVKKRS
jgi:IS4 transposase